MHAVSAGQDSLASSSSDSARGSMFKCVLEAVLFPIVTAAFAAETVFSICKQ